MSSSGAQWLSGRELYSRPRGQGARHIYPSLVLVQPRKTRPCLTERLLMGRKESNQTNVIFASMRMERSELSTIGLRGCNVCLIPTMLVAMW